MVNDVVQLINYAITAKCPSEWALKVHGLASPILVLSDDEDNETAFPSVIDHLTGECEPVFLDDDYTCGWYHRLLSKTYGKAKGFGDADRDVEIADLLLVCWGFTKSTTKTAEQIESTIVIPAMPVQVQLISSNFDQFNVFSQEFKKVDYNLHPEEFLFSFRYRVQYPFIRECR